MFATSYLLFELFSHEGYLQLSNDILFFVLILDIFLF